MWGYLATKVKIVDVVAFKRKQRKKQIIKLLLYVDVREGRDLQLERNPATPFC